MYNPTTRLLTILELLQSRGHLSAQELAQSLEVEERSIRRYITMLRDIGIPIESERGRYGGYALRPGYRLPPLMFNHEEITAVMVGLLLMRELGSVSALAVDSATAKIERVLPEELQQRSHALRHFLTLDNLPPRTHSVSSQWMLAFSLAALDKRCLLISYISASGEVSQRVISPYGLVLHGRAWYIPAYCHLRQDRRIFRLDRVREVMDSECTYENTDIDPKAYVLESLARVPGMSLLEVMLHAPLETVSDYIPASTAILENEAGETLMRCYVDDPYWFARYLMSLEFRFTVRQTDELREALRIIAERTLAIL
jgi:predicted DNA-binding transcriptional regulator YafY